jgi:putative ABC transport system permease protein
VRDRQRRAILWAFDRALGLYPDDFRRRFGAAMRQALVDRLDIRSGRAGALALAFAVRAVANTAAQGIAERRFERARRRTMAAAIGRGKEPMRELAQDLRFAVRMIGRRPAVAVLSILTLTLGIGASAAVFSLVDASLLRPLSLPEPDRLVVVMESSKGRPGMVAYDNFVDWQRGSTAFEALTVFRPQSVNLTGLDTPDRVRGGFVTSGFFGVAGVVPALGRALAPADDEPNAAPVAVINETVWRQRFGRAPDILGRQIHLNNVAFTIVGVMPDGFYFPWDGAEVWLPLHFTPGTLSRTAHNLVAFGRLRRGAPVDTGRADLATIATRLARDYPASNEDRGVLVQPLQQWLTASTRTGLEMVFALVLVLLAAACANVTSLQVGATAARRAEMAIRAALGAGRRRLARQLLTEHLLLAALSGVLGVALAAVLVPLAVHAAPAGLFGLDRVRIDARVVAFSVLVSTLAGVLSGVLPALHWAGRAPAESLRGAGRSVGERWLTRTRGLLVAGQVTMAAVLLTAAGLLVQSYAALVRVDPGFRGDHLLTMEYRLPANKYADPARQTAFHDAVAAEVAKVPGVRRAAVVRGLPLSGNGDIIGYLTVGAAPGADPRSAAFNTVSDDYFRAMGIPLFSGRTFDSRDRADAPPVVVLSRSFAEQAWPGDEAIGQHVVIPGFPVQPTVIGVVGDIRQFGLAEDALPQFYARNAQNPGIFMTLVAETDGDPLALSADVRRALWRVDPDQPVWKIRTLASLVDGATEGSRLLFVALALFSGAAVILVVAGLYGVASQAVSRRAREIGMRLVLGATRADVLKQVLVSGLRPTLVGLAAGLAIAATSARLLGSLLYGVPPASLVPYAATAGILLLVAVLACYMPARRAAALDPAVVLREG